MHGYSPSPRPPSCDQTTDCEARLTCEGQKTMFTAVVSVSSAGDNWVEASWFLSNFFSNGFLANERLYEQGHGQGVSSAILFAHFRLCTCFGLDSKYKLRLRNFADYALFVVRLTSG